MRTVNAFDTMFRMRNHCTAPLGTGALIPRPRTATPNRTPTAEPDRLLGRQPIDDRPPGMRGGALVAGERGAAQDGVAVRRTAPTTPSARRTADRSPPARPGTTAPGPFRVGTSSRSPPYETSTTAAGFPAAVTRKPPTTRLRGQRRSRRTLERQCATVSRKAAGRIGLPDERRLVPARFEVHAAAHRSR